MQKNTKKSKNPNNIVKKLLAIILSVSIGGGCLNFPTHAQVNNDNSFSQQTAANQSNQEDYLAEQNPFISDDECMFCFNFLCIIPIMALAIFKIMADIAQGFSSSSKMDK